MFRPLLFVIIGILSTTVPVFSYDSPSSNVESEAIFKLIIDRNPRVSIENARLIADSLVDAGEEMDVDPKLVAAIMSVESKFNHTANHNGALGLGQLMRGTARYLGVRDPFSITQNVTGTTKYIKEMLNIWQGHPQQTAMALVSYLKGPVYVRRSKTPIDQRAARYIQNVMGYHTQVSDYSTTLKSNSPPQ